MAVWWCREPAIARQLFLSSSKIILSQDPLLTARETACIAAPQLCGAATRTHVATRGAARRGAARAAQSRQMRAAPQPGRTCLPRFRSTKRRYALVSDLRARMTELWRNRRR